MNFPRLASLLRNLLHKQGEERELDEEVRAHEQLLVDENIQAGMKPSVKHAWSSAALSK
jgi:hypothetical protein